MTTLREASEALSTEFVRGLRGGCLPEADEYINEASRRVISAMRDELGAAWIGRINMTREECSNPDYPVVWEYEGGMVYNFGADFVIPAFDTELARMVREYNAGPWEARKSSNQITTILERVRELGGASLVWT